MYKRLIAGLAVGLLTAHAAHAVTIGGRDYDESAAVDTVLGSYGTYDTHGDNPLTDLDASTYAFSFTKGAYVELGWSAGQAVNGAGTDIDLYELGVPDSVSVTINGVSHVYALDQAVGHLGYTLNRASIDLSDFGIADGAGVSSILIGMDIESPLTRTVPSLSFVGANTIAAVPEPEAVLMMALGLVAVGAAARRKA